MSNGCTQCVFLDGMNVFFSLVDNIYYRFMSIVSVADKKRVELHCSHENNFTVTHFFFFHVLFLRECKISWCLWNNICYFKFILFLSLLLDYKNKKLSFILFCAVQHYASIHSYRSRHSTIWSSTQCTIWIMLWFFRSKWFSRGIEFKVTVASLPLVHFSAQKIVKKS